MSISERVRVACHGEHALVTGTWVTPDAHSHLPLPLTAHAKGSPVPEGFSLVGLHLAWGLLSPTRSQFARVLWLLVR